VCQVLLYSPFPSPFTFGTVAASPSDTSPPMRRETSFCFSRAQIKLLCSPSISLNAIVKLFFLSAFFGALHLASRRYVDLPSAHLFFFPRAGLAQKRKVGRGLFSLRDPSQQRGQRSFHSSPAWRGTEFVSRCQSKCKCTAEFFFVEISAFFLCAAPSPHPSPTGIDPS